MENFRLLANHMADQSGAVIRLHFRQPFEVETKTDASPVTVADRAAEAKIREIIEAERPEDGILGEEYGPKESRSGYTWVLDPIDGTKSFVIGRPTFGTLIALCKDGVPVLGIIDQPVLNERWVGVEGSPTTFNGKAVSTRQCQDLKKAVVGSTAPAQLAPPACGGMTGETAPHLWQILDRECAYTIWGGDCYSYGLLANGGLDAVVETMLAPYDCLALVPVVTGAGGWMGDWNGNPLTLSRQDKAGRTLAVGDVAMKDVFLNLLNQ